MASETVKELGIEVIEVSSDKQTASSITSRQGTASTLQRKGAWARAELRQLLEPKAWRRLLISACLHILSWAVFKDRSSHPWQIVLNGKSDSTSPCRKRSVSRHQKWSCDFSLILSHLEFKRKSSEV